MIQEMEDTLVEIRSAAAKCIADRKEQQRYAEFLEKEQQGLGQAGRTGGSSGIGKIWPGRHLKEKQNLADEVEQTQHETEMLMHNWKSSIRILPSCKQAD